MAEEDDAGRETGLIEASLTRGTLSMGLSAAHGDTIHSLIFEALVEMADLHFIHASLVPLYVYTNA